MTSPCRLAAGGGLDSAPRADQRQLERWRANVGGSKDEGVRGRRRGFGGLLAERAHPDRRVAPERPGQSFGNQGPLDRPSLAGVLRRVGGQEHRQHPDVARPGLDRQAGRQPLQDRSFEREGNAGAVT